MVKYKYERHHFEFMEKCFSKGINSPAQILKGWTFIDMVPTTSSLKRRITSLKEYGIEVCVKNSDRGWGPGKKWTDKEEEDLALAFELCKGSQDDTVNLFVECSDGERNVNGATVRLQHLADNGQITLNNGMGKKKDYREDFLVKGLSIVGDYMGNAKTYFEAECSAFGHRVKVRGDMPLGCKVCKNMDAPRHPDPLAPGIFYYGPLLESPLNDLKLGNTLERIGVKERSKKYGKFKWKEIHKPIGEVEKFEREMKIKYENYCTHNPMLKGNGSTECFDLIILPDLEKDIKEWIK